MFGSSSTTSTRAPFDGCACWRPPLVLTAPMLPGNPVSLLRIYLGGPMSSICGLLGRRLEVTAGRTISPAQPARGRAPDFRPAVGVQAGMVGGLIGLQLAVGGGVVPKIEDGLAAGELVRLSPEIVEVLNGNGGVAGLVYVDHLLERVPFGHESHGDAAQERRPPWQQNEDVEGNGGGAG